MNQSTAAVGAVIVSYGSSSRALRCAESLLQAACAPTHVVIVNNGPRRFESTSYDVRDVESSDLPHLDATGQVTVFEAGGNLGYSGGLRLGIAALLEAELNVEYLWLLNNDLVVHESALTELLRAADEDQGVGLWGCTVCADEDFEVIAGVGVRYSKWTTRRRVVLGGVRTEEAIASRDEPILDFIPGSSMFISRKTYEASGGLSDSYFLYFEELDLAARVQNLGLTVGWCRKALVAHVGGASTGSYRAGRSRPTSVAYHATRSALIYTRRHARHAVPAVLASRVFGYACVRAGKGDFGSARAALRGCRDGLLADVRYRGGLR